MPQPSVKKPPDPPRGPVLWLRQADQVVAATVLAISLAAIGGYWVWQGKLAGRLIEIDRAEPIAVELKIDINSADWPERATRNLFGTGRPPALARIA